MYKEMLIIARKENINAISLLVAVEVKFQLKRYSEKVRFYAKNPGVIFESICDFVENCYLKSEGLNIEDIAYVTCMLLYEENKKLHEISKRDVYERINEIWR